MQPTWLRAAVGAAGGAAEAAFPGLGLPIAPLHVNAPLLSPPPRVWSGVDRSRAERSFPFLVGGGEEERDFCKKAGKGVERAHDSGCNCCNPQSLLSLLPSLRVGGEER